MSQEQEYPLLSSASYQRPVTPRQSNNNISEQHDSPINPPEIIRHTSSHESLRSASVSMTVTSDVSLTASDIRAMSQELSEARQNNEIPRTSSSPLNAQAVVEDYGFLIRLREERGDRSTTPTEPFRHLLVEVSRRIKERDSVLDENEVKKEAARRVSNYLSTLEHEQFIYNAATSAPGTPSIQGSSASQVDAETFTEEVLSIIEQVADQTLVDATEPLRHHEKVMKILDKCLREDSFALKDRVKSLTGHDNVYAHLLQKLEKMHQQQNMVFQLHDESLREHDASLRDHDNSLQALSDTLSICGSFYSAQNAALQNHTQAFNQRLMVHNQLNVNQEDINAMSSQLLDQYRGIVSSLQSMVQYQGQTTVASAQNLSTISGIISQLNAAIMSLPGAMHQSVQLSVSQNIQPAIQRIMQAQQQAMLALREEESRRTEIDYEFLANTIADNIIAQRAEETKSKKGSKFCKAMKKLFRS